MYQSTSVLKASWDRKLFSWCMRCAKDTTWAKTLLKRIHIDIYVWRMYTLELRRRSPWHTIGLKGAQPLSLSLYTHARHIYIPRCSPWQIIVWKEAEPIPPITISDVPWQTVHHVWLPKKYCFKLGEIPIDSPRNTLQSCCCNILCLIYHTGDSWK